MSSNRVMDNPNGPKQKAGDGRLEHKNLSNDNTSLHQETS